MNKITRILIIDDIHFLRRVLKDAFSVFDGYKLIETAQGYEEAKAILEENSDFNLITMDIALKNCTGIEAARLIIEDYPHLENRIVFISQYPNLLRNTNFAHYPVIKKPCSLEDIGFIYRQHKRMEAEWV